MTQVRFSMEFGKQEMTPIQAVDLTTYMSALIERDKAVMVQEMYFDRFEYMTTKRHKSVPSEPFMNTSKIAHQLLQGMQAASPVIWDTSVLADILDGNEIFTGLPCDDFIDLIDKPMVWFYEKVKGITYRAQARQFWRIDADVVPFGFYVVPLKIYPTADEAMHEIEKTGGVMVYTDKLSVSAVAIFLLYFNFDEIKGDAAKMRFKALSLIKRGMVLSDDVNCFFGAMIKFLHDKIKPENSVRLPRQFRRQCEREKRIVPNVYVVRLRKLDYGDREEITNKQGEINWHYRWYVRRHWRNQWHPKLGKHVPVFIERYMKNAEATHLPIKEQVPVVYKADR